MNVKTKIDWTNKNLILFAAKGKESMKDILISLGLSKRGNNYKTLKKWADIHGICLPSYKYKPPSSFKRILSNEFIFSKNDARHSKQAKKRIIKDNLLAYVCCKCGNNGEWMEQKLVLHIDHIDGDPCNNLLSNLRFLCPNCHSQTTTYAGRNMKRRKIQEQPKVKVNTKKFDISIEELTILINSTPISKISKMFSVSDSAIIKRCKKLNIKTPGRGYWARVYSGKL